MRLKGDHRRSIHGDEIMSPTAPKPRIYSPPIVRELPKPPADPGDVEAW